jgi:lysocardiolipin and lysophospholipid acyltransferase
VVNVGYLSQRRLEDDEPKIRSMLRRYIQDGPPLALMLFPEGTDLSQRNLEASHAYSDKAGLPNRNFTLYPRTKGWWLCCEEFGDAGLDEIVDVTLAYTGPVPQNESAVVRSCGGLLPRELVSVTAV